MQHSTRKPCIPAATILPLTPLLVIFFCCPFISPFSTSLPTECRNTFNYFLLFLFQNAPMDFQKFSLTFQAPAAVARCDVMLRGWASSQRLTHRC